jgi:hypothetical protein
MDAARTCGGASPVMASTICRSVSSPPPSSDGACRGGADATVHSATSVTSGWSPLSASPRAVASSRR